MKKRIPLIAHDIKKMYTALLIVVVVLFVICSVQPGFNVMTLVENSDPFWE